MAENVQESIYWLPSPMISVTLAGMSFKSNTKIVIVAQVSPASAHGQVKVVSSIFIFAICHSNASSVVKHLFFSMFKESIVITTSFGNNLTNH